MKRILRMALAALITLQFSNSIAQPGTLDNAFDGDGKVTTNYPLDVRDVIVESNGNIIVVGEYNDGIRVIKYNTNGTIDTSFGNAGLVTISLQGLDLDVESILAQDAQNILLSGSFSHNGNSPDDKLFIIKLHANGKIDSAFGNNGIGINDSIGFGWGDCSNPNSSSYYTYSGGKIALQSDGKIVQVGERRNYCLNDRLVHAYRYNTNGSIDTTFICTSDFVPHFYSEKDVHSLYIDENDWIYVGCNGESILSVDSGIKVPFVSTFPPNGDNGLNLSYFRCNVVRLNAFGNVQSFDGSFIKGHNGGLIVGGNVYDGVKNKFGIARFTNLLGSLNGSNMDSSFGGNNNGLVFIDPISGDNYVMAAAVQSDGKIILAGYGDSGGFTLNDFILVRLNANGTLDNTFGNNGIVITDVNTNSNDELKALCLQNDGKILAAGTTYLNSSLSIVLARYNNDASLSVNDFEQAFEANVLPNPATNYLSINIEGNQTEQINIYNYNGQLLKTVTLPQTNTVDVSDLTSGIYIAEIKVNGYLQRVKWIKM